MKLAQICIALCLAAVVAQDFTAQTRPVKHNKPQPYVPEPNEQNTLSDNGHKLLWLAFFALALPSGYFASEMFKQDDGKRYFHMITFGVTAIASLAYLAMATGNGVYVRPFDGREFFYARYIDWTFTTPLQLLDILGFAGASQDTVSWMLGADLLMIIAGLIGAFLDGNEKYYFWFFGMAMFIPILYMLVTGLKANLPADPAVQAVYGRIAMLTAVTWSCYPVVWLAAEGTGNISADTEAICYTILDVLAKSFFGIIIVSARDACNTATASK